MLTHRSLAAFAIAVLGALTLGAHGVRADVTDVIINMPNAALTGFTGPYANVHIDRASTTSATITFTSLTNGGFIYLMGAQGAADLNVNGTYSLGAVTELNSIAGFTPTFSANNPGNVDGFGTFNLALDNADGFGDSATSVQFSLTATGATSWSSAANVLAPNAFHSLAAVHAFACAQPGCSITRGAAATGFARAPEPASLALLGTALGGLIFLSRRRRTT